MRKLSFITANYVARQSGYSGSEDWMAHDALTIAAMNADHFASLAADIAAAGFSAIDIWSAHCSYPEHNRGDYLEQVKGICSNLDLEIASYAGGLRFQTRTELEAVLGFIKRLGATIFAGGIFGPAGVDDGPMVDEAFGKFGLRWAFENHPQKSPAEILARIGGGRLKHCGVALDTGWCGTQSMDALEAAKRLREHLTIVHLKDVKAPGRHDTCALGDGVVPVEKVARYLVESDWHGTICIEHEPYDRDPMPEVKISMERVKRWLA